MSLTAVGSPSFSRLHADPQQDAEAEKIKALYGEPLCTIFGCSTIKNIPEVTPEQLPLDGFTSYSVFIPLPCSMSSHNLVRGIGKHRAFIAMKCDILDAQKKVTEVVEFLFRDIPSEFTVSSKDDPFETASLIPGANGQKYMTAFFNSKKNEPNSYLVRFKKVMDGEVLERFPHDRHNPPTYIKMSAKI